MATFRKNGDWVQHGNVIHSGADDLALSRNGDCLVVGEYDLYGSFRVYEFSDNDWKQLGSEQFLPENATPLYAAECDGGVVAAPVSISPDCKTVAVGSPNTHVNGASRAGLDRVYDWQGEDWKQRGVDKDLVGHKEGDQFGIDMALSADGNTVAIGAFERTHDFRFPGYAQVFEWNNDSWSQLGQTLLGKAPGDLFGGAISISEDGYTVAIGAPYSDNEGGNYSGQVRIYRFDRELSRWLLLGQVLNGKRSGDDLGRNLELAADGKSLCISGTQRGFCNDAVIFLRYLRVYRFDSTIGEWKLEAESMGQAHNGWGSSCSISPDGRLVAHGQAGHWRVDDGGDNVNVFELDVATLEEAVE